ncbi:helix-turn-helix domain-containing protein [Streptomyces sp. NPDC059398]|uniref:helix-turn-helix domain-containing protein n=1 Tax=Streptomyces sp. NPDC059398 TaxID=3346820 RepID=UPI0036CF2690
MGRRENAVAASTRQSEALALWLRAQRERRGVTYAAMAKLTGHQFSASMLSRGASGRTVPSRRLVLVYVRACEADVGQALWLWKAARSAEQRGSAHSPAFQNAGTAGNTGNTRNTGAAENTGTAGTAENTALASSVRSMLNSVATRPDVVDSFATLRRVMVEMRVREGQPSLAELQRAAGKTADGKRHRLPKSSLSVILRGEAVPSRAHLTAFMEALNVEPAGVRRWQQVWDCLRAAQSPPVNFTIRFLDAPPDGQPDGAPAPVADVGTADRAFVREQVVGTTSGVRGGPRAAHRPVGRTRAGLPIRTPRRYNRAAPRQPYEPVFSTRTRPIPPRIPVIVPLRPAEPAAPAGRIARTVKRWFPRKPRAVHVPGDDHRPSWPDY